MAGERRGQKLCSSHRKVRLRRKGVIGRAGGHLSCTYNDWLRGFCSHYPDREIGLACLPCGDIDDAVAEIRRVAKMGIKGLELSCSWDMEPMWHPVWEPLWNAVEDVQLPLHFHTFPTTSPRAREGVSGQVRRAATFTGVSAFQMGLINITPR
jgi:predicted TIM-barrel fold metal-dependent hydrolase